ncbi:DNA polymerase Y family protein [Labedella populi]|uniref:DNA polymerase Y family protein n=1 Tax=Labedella populi TaxID=2498850 RepID=A0A3S3ZQI4_9MICO|nr:DNA polymerase Y family protein [Labedella populi]RWZ64454.1 DNA polymerase Y family protein [Labedella populi]
MARGRSATSSGSAPAAVPPRVLLLWCPDWPVIAAAEAAGLPPSAPLALVVKGEIFACSASARREGVARGLRVREAQARCPGLMVLPYDADLDHRAFEPVISAVEAIVPGAQLVRPGTLAVKARGPSRYYGGEVEAAEAVLDVVAAAHPAGQRTDGADGVVPPGVIARVGVADSLFAAEQLAKARMRGPEDVVRVVPPGRTREFLAPLPLSVLERPELTTVLRRLGIDTLGHFAALDAVEVRDRFGEDGERLHALSSGRDPRDVETRTPPPDLGGEIVFETALDRVDQIAFAFRQVADDIVGRLRAATLVTTAIRVEIGLEDVGVRERSWLHPRWFTASDIVDRVRWQIQGNGRTEGLEAAVESIRVEPESVDAMSRHEQGLWGTGSDERVHHGLSRVQSMVGHDGVLTARLTGGRMPGQRQVLVPWGDRPPGGEKAVAESVTLPWPGAIPGPAPSVVFPEPRPVVVIGPDGLSVEVDDRGAFTTPPVRFGIGEKPERTSPVSAWAGPWPVSERWWDSAARSLQRVQLVDEAGRAWLLVLVAHRWWAEAVYD